MNNNNNSINDDVDDKKTEEKIIISTKKSKIENEKADYLTNERKALEQSKTEGTIDEKTKKPKDDDLLLLASKNGEFEIVKYLIENQANLNHEDNEKRTPLFLASSNGDLEIVKYLIEKKANLNHEDNRKWTPLIFASENGDLEIVKYLIENQANLNHENNNQWPPLFFASSNGHLETVKYLIENQANLNETNEKWTPLFWPSLKGHLEIVKYLIENQANLNHEDNHKWTPLFFASQNGHLEIVKYLIENQANLNHEDNYKCTPLFLASQNGHLEIVKNLIEQKANIHSSDSSGQTSLFIAAENGHFKVVEYLSHFNIPLCQKNSLEKALYKPYDVMFFRGNRETMEKYPNIGDQSIKIQFYQNLKDPFWFDKINQIFQDQREKANSQKEIVTIKEKFNESPSNDDPLFQCSEELVYFCYSIAHRQKAFENEETLAKPLMIDSLFDTFVIVQIQIWVYPLPKEYKLFFWDAQNQKIKTFSIQRSSDKTFWRFENDQFATLEDLCRYSKLTKNSYLPLDSVLQIASLTEMKKKSLLFVLMCHRFAFDSDFYYQTLPKDILMIIINFVDFFAQNSFEKITISSLPLLEHDPWKD